MEYQAYAPLTYTANKAGLTNGTTTTFSFTANPLQYVINGKFYSKATQTNTATPTTDGNTGVAFLPVPAGSASACYGCAFVWGYDAGGNVKVYQGPITALTTIAADGANCAFGLAPAFPSVPGGVVPFGYSIVKVGSSGAAFTMGSTSLASGSNISVAHQDVSTLPDRPQVA